ncbi:MAG TPA: EFR1 family ferrodoxin, partial [Bacillota bacterium]|nr:EFR1 family ferrodoxin [Bacillota bacterium]
MQTVLYYFTGTGNSLVIANDLARELNCPKPIPMAAFKENEQTEAEIIGLIFPVYFLDMPELVKEFLQRLQINKPSAYIFAVTNCGGDAGNTLVNLD